MISDSQISQRIESQMIYPVKPLFVFSLQRSGSTLLQRLLAAHPEIATASETHMLLPLFHAIRDQGVYSQYGHNLAAWAFQDFCQELPNGTGDYLQEVRELANRLYNKAAGGKGRYFVDKAGKYHLIVEDIIRLFSGEKFIFLWRNPLAVIASFMDSWEKGRWNIYHYEISLYEGLANLVTAYQKYGSQACAIRYEDMVSRPDEVFPGVFEYLELSYDPSIVTGFSQVKLSGRVGDQWGVKQYNGLSTGSIEKWKRTLSNPLRKTWCKRYLRWLGSERLAVMGYDLDQLLDELNAIPFSLAYAGSDLVRMPFGAAYRVFEFRLLKHKWEDFRAGKRLYIHT